MATFPSTPGVSGEESRPQIDAASPRALRVRARAEGGGQPAKKKTRKKRSQVAEAAGGVAPKRPKKLVLDVGMTEAAAAEAAMAVVVAVGGGERARQAAKLVQAAEAVEQRLARIAEHMKEAGGDEEREVGEDQGGVGVGGG